MLWACLVASLVSFTCAPAITLPLASWIVPEMIAVVWDRVADGKRENASARSRSGKISRGLNDRRRCPANTLAAKTHAEPAHAKACLQRFLQIIVPPEFQAQLRDLLPGCGSSFRWI